jgi:LemA protein
VTTLNFDWLPLLLAAAVVVYAAVLFNRLVRARQMANEGWSGIDVQLKRRADLVPNLVDTVKGYAAHERGLFQEITELRNQANALPRDDVEGRARAEGALSMALGRLFALVENYPDLKASANFLELQQELSRLETDIQMARRYYNGAVRNLNILVESVPSNLVARLFGFGQRAFFELADAAERAAPRVQMG